MPKIFKPRRRQLGVPHGVLDIAMTEIRLQRSRIMSLVRQSISTGMPEHVWVRLKAKPSLDACPFDHAGKPSGTERRSSLRGEHEG